MASFRSASYTRGITTPGQSPFNPTDAPQQDYPNNGNQSNAGQLPYISHQSSFPHMGNSNKQPGADDAMELSQYRRHAFSMSAAPSRFGASAPIHEMESKPNGARRPRSASWAPESPKKVASGVAVRYGSKTMGESKGRLWCLSRRFEESKYFSSRIIKNNKKEFLCWFMLACLIVVGYKFFSDGSFSAVLTLSSALQCFALVLLNMKVLSQHSVAGVSQRTLFLIVGSLSCRLVSTIFYNGYLPVDRSGDWAYQAADVLTVIFALILIIYSRRHCQTSIQQQQDKDTCVVVIPIIITFILSLLIHPSLNQNLLADVAWTFALYVETFAMIPQLFMMGKIGGEVEALTSHYVASMAGSKVFSFLFWYFSYNELAPKIGGYNLAGWAVLFSNSAQALLFVDFFYYYVKSIRVGRKMIINF